MISVANDDNIHDLLDRLRGGDQQAASAIYRGYYGAVKSFVGLYVDDPSAAEEIVDDAFLAAFEHPHRFEGRSSFKTWLMGIAKNKSLDWLRRANREPAISVGDSQPMLDQLVDPQWPAFEHMASEQIRAIVRFCLQRLPIAQREVTYFVFYEEMSIDQAASQVNCPPGTVKSRLFNARVKLAECLKRRLSIDEVMA